MWEWATNHKTMILLNGGMASDLLRLEDFLDTADNPFAWTAFREEKDALNGSITSVGIVLSEKIYLGADMMRSELITREEFKRNPTLQLVPDAPITEYTKIEAALMFNINVCRLAT